jgi:hypothetical protein
MSEYSKGVRLLGGQRANSASSFLARAAIDLRRSLTQPRLRPRLWRVTEVR